MCAGFVTIHLVAPADIAHFKGYRGATKRVPLGFNLIKILGMKRFPRTCWCLAD